MVSKRLAHHRFLIRRAVIASVFNCSSRCSHLRFLVFFALLSPSRFRVLLAAQRGFCRFYECGRIRPYSVPVFLVRFVLAGNSSVLAALCLVLPWPGRGAILMFRRTFLCPRFLVFSVLYFRLRWRGSYLLFRCRCSVARFQARLCSFLLWRCFVARFWLSALAQGFGDSNSTDANVPTHGTTRRCTRPPTAYARSSLRLPAAGELSRSTAARGFDGNRAIIERRLGKVK